ncbi:hypothetical protein ACFUYE_27945, partial [Micromonospora humida]|uniref:hypothetical protein n=1 Tax=Micromonospora humida TaxID=2809018 RepID=UPI0036723B31
TFIRSWRRPAESRSAIPAADGVHNVERGLARTAQGWEVQPEGLTRLLQRLWTEYAQPAGVALAGLLTLAAGVLLVVTVRRVRSRVVAA